MTLDPKIAKVEIRGVSGVNLVTLEELGIGDGGGGVDPSDIKITVDEIEDASAISKSILKESDATNILSLINASPANHNHTSATNTVAGFMSTTDKVKLDGIAVGATVNSTDATLLNRGNHTGTQSISTVVGIVPIAQIPTGTTATTVALGNHTHAVATTSVAGFMSGADKTKLDGIAQNANYYVLPTATTSTIGGVLKATGVEDSSGEDLQALKTTLNELLANLREAGIMY